MSKIFQTNKFFIYCISSLIWVFFSIPLLIRKIRRFDNAKDPINILIIELWGIGDLVMMSAVLKPLKDAYPSSKITLLSKDIAQTLFMADPRVDAFVNFDFPWTQFKGKYAFWRWNWPALLRTIDALKKQNFDLVLDARGDIRNNLFSFLINGKKRVGYDWTGGGYFLTDLPRTVRKNIHRVDAWLNLLSHLGIDAGKYAPDIYLTRDEEDAAKGFLTRQGIGTDNLLIGIHSGAGRKSRCWPLKRFAELAEQLMKKFRAKIIIFVEPEGYGDDISLRGDIIKVKIPLRDMIGIIKQLDLLICNDSGAMHIASAVGTKTIDVFGPGDYNKIGPYGAGHTIVADDAISCRPCFDYCKFDKAVCLDNISVDKVGKAAYKILEGMIL